ncbi:MAG: FecR domain-containing protein [Opitutae bacterium]|nr:FecR domain-containing protein [Opitutae bacterium]
MNHSPPRSADAAADEQASLWAARLDGSVLSADDRRALDDWLARHPGHRALLSSYCQFSADLEQRLPLLEGIREQSAEIRKKTNSAQPRPRLRWPTMARVALSAAAAVVLVFWLVRPPAPQVESLTTPVAQRQTVTLADGSRVELNAHTSLLVELGAHERRVRLADGEAFFAVTKDAARPFVIETPGGSVRVTGTQFNVRAEADAPLEVTVLEGSVQVRPGATAPGRDSAPFALRAGDQLVAGPAGIAVHPLAPAALADALAWRQGQIVFNGAPLREALARFARYHGRGITVTADAAGLPVGGRFSLDDLDGFLAGIEPVLHVHVTRDLSGTVRVSTR